ALELEQLPGPPPRGAVIRVAHPLHRKPGDACPARPLSIRAYDGAVAVARGPGVGEQLPPLALEAGVQLPREPVERFAQRRPPALLARALGREPAAAIGPPALHAMRA